MKVPLPRGVDDPPLFLLWPMDEFLYIMVLLGGGILMKKLTIAIVVIFVTVRIYRRFRDGNPEGYFMHWLYGMGLILPKSRVFTNPFEDIYLP